jgi:hypothetical protein
MKKNLQKMGTALTITALMVLPLPIVAQEGPADQVSSIDVEMNSTAQLDGACQLTFMLRNGLETDISSLVFETVLLTTAGAVDRLTLFDMRDLPSGSPRVRQFNVPELACNELGQVLINGVSDCSGDGIDGAMCSQALTYTSRIDVEILG